MARDQRDRFLSVMAVLYGLLTISNFTKAFQYLSHPERGGIVIFGVRFEGVLLNLIFGPLMGLVVGAYAYGLWKRAAWVRNLATVYAFYVPTNLVIFWYRHQVTETPPLTFLLVYLAIAFTGSIGTALYLASHPDALQPRAA